MNKLELQLVDLLIDLKENHFISAIKAEFEAEGSRMEEVMRLKDIISKAGLNLNIKIGGCEAIKDMIDAGNLGIQRIIAPMIETPYALQKFIGAAKMVYGEALSQIELLINIETETAYNNFSAMLQVPEVACLNGIVIGRSDLVGSMGMKDNQVNDKKVLDMSLDLARKAKEKGLSVVIGGGVTAESIPFVKAFPEGHLDRFETRKVIFQCPGVFDNANQAILKALNFETL
jgi:4-hydroxy-2-oxoheptanedioate aldolase